MMNTIVADKWLDCEHKLGQYMEDTDYDIVIDSDTDFYSPNKVGVDGISGPSEDTVIFKFRKGVFTEQEQRGAYEGLVGAATPTQNRGIAAGPKAGKLNNRDWVTDRQLAILDHFIKPTKSLFGEDPLEEIERKYSSGDQGSARGLVWLRSAISDAGYNYETFFSDKLDELKAMSKDAAATHASTIKKGFISDTTYANQVLSGIAGFYDRYPRIPYGRATSYTRDNFELYEKCYPFMVKLSEKFSELLPRRYSAQKKCADLLDPKFRVAGEKTPFTTITVNKNFRTAAHRDAGDLSEGFSNLTVVANDKEWEGGLLVLPEFRVAVNIRPGDLLLINNHQGIHGNTEIIPPAGKTIEEMERISLVCYFRENMLQLGSWEYEQHRYEYVESRRKNPDHPHQRKLWNGVSESMWSDQEWYDYLLAHGGSEMLYKYHPESEKKEVASIEGFFA